MTKLTVIVDELTVKIEAPGSPRGARSVQIRKTFDLPFDPFPGLVIEDWDGNPVPEGEPATQDNLYTLDTVYYNNVTRAIEAEATFGVTAIVGESIDDVLKPFKAAGWEVDHVLNVPDEEGPTCPTTTKTNATDSRPASRPGGG
jgi:hypothetical protein